MTTASLSYFQSRNFEKRDFLWKLKLERCFWNFPMHIWVRYFFFIGILAWNSFWNAYLCSFFGLVYKWRMDQKLFWIVLKWNEHVRTRFERSKWSGFWIRRPGKSVQPDFKVISDSIRYDQILKNTRILLGIIILELRKVTVYIRFYGFWLRGLES